MVNVEWRMAGKRMDKSGGCRCQQAQRVLVVAGWWSLQRAEDAGLNKTDEK